MAFVHFSPSAIEAAEKSFARKSFSPYDGAPMSEMVQSRCTTRASMRVKLCCYIFLVILASVIVFISSPSGRAINQTATIFFPTLRLLPIYTWCIAQLHYGASRVHKHPKASLLHATFALRVISQRANDAYNQ